MQDYYEVLGVSPTADRDAIAAAYRRKSSSITPTAAARTSK